VLFRCYAKINLTLEILGRRADGYHELASLVLTVSLSDELRIEPADQLISRVEGLAIAPSANLVTRAAELLRKHTGTRAGAELTLTKRIPAAAGLGGGSSDAATALVGLNRLWATRLDNAELQALAAELGSDVPYFVSGGAALMRGRGDDVLPVPGLTNLWLVLAMPAHDLPDKTRQLYTALTAADFSDGQRTARILDRLARGQRPPFDESELLNGFQRAARAVFGGLSMTWDQLERVCDRRFHLSGAGPALFAFASTQAEARHLCRLLVELGVPAEAVHTTSRARWSARSAPPCS
jgi:4-diphosphocytidyl-2-C-methyl-D-erythritol kinase